jgi:Tol biopolymer transport system component
MSLGLFGCGQGEDLAGPEPAVLQVTTETSGTGTDPDGYTVAIDGRQSVPLALMDTLIESGVTPGEHTVDLGGVAAGCSVLGGGSRTVTAVAGATASTSFVVTCNASVSPTGVVVVVVTTTGDSIDSDGYVVAVDPSYRRAVGVSEEVRLEGIAQGERSIGLSGVAANCSVQGENPRPIDVPPVGEVATAFAVRCWLPATGSIAFVRSVATQDFIQDFIQVIGVDGVLQHSFSSSGSAALLSWSPDGELLAWSNEASAILVQPPSGDPAVGLPSAGSPIWSPDSDRLLCLSEGGRLSSVTRNGSGQRFLVPDDGTRVTSAHYLPDGRIFLVAGIPEGGFAAFRVAADGRDLTRLFRFPEEFLLEQAAVPSPDGQRVAYPLETDHFGLHVANIDGTNAHLVSAALDVTSAPVWSPDATRLAFPAGVGALWLVSPDGTELLPVELPGVLLGQVGWSPDGSYLVAPVSTRVDDDGRPRGSSIYTIRADGSGAERLTASDHEDQEPVWRPTVRRP